uniref:Outer membrane protein beta-barrel domain-containing protein n=1 Tax=Tolypothrix bouteillei VB521301 TaxID=1479485 RepID=A0A0C1NA64_9CYAN
MSFPKTAPQSNSTTTLAQPVSPIAVNSAAKPIPGKALTSASALLAKPSKSVVPTMAQADTTTPGTITPGQTIPGTTTPDTTTPGTTTPDTTTPGQTIPDTTTPDTTTPGQTIPGTTTPGRTTPDTNGVSPGRSTRSGPSYFGIGGNIGLGSGDTALGEGSFAIFSKLGLARSFSVRPSLYVSDDPTLLIPVTYDLLPIGVPGGGRFSVAPYLGAGAAISFGDDTSVDFLVTGGVDVPLTPQFTATAAVNVTAFDNTAVGLVIGVGYNFSGF